MKKKIQAINKSKINSPKKPNQLVSPSRIGDKLLRGSMDFKKWNRRSIKSPRNNLRSSQMEAERVFKSPPKPLNSPFNGSIYKKNKIRRDRQNYIGDSSREHQLNAKTLSKRGSQRRILSKQGNNSKSKTSYF